MDLNEFRKTVRSKNAHTLAEEFLRHESVAVFPTLDRYLQFKDAVTRRYAEAEFVAVVGTANWWYSLNPYKDFKPFDATSDVDTVVVSDRHFTDAWDALRKYDRVHGYRLSSSIQSQLRRNGENVYAGFVSPTWIPDRQDALRYSHQQALNALSDANVDYKPVKMLFFRNFTEAVDYYSRGFRKAKGRLQ